MLVFVEQTGSNFKGIPKGRSSRFLPRLLEVE